MNWLSFLRSNSRGQSSEPWGRKLTLEKCVHPLSTLQLRLGKGFYSGSWVSLLHFTGGKDRRHRQQVQHFAKWVRQQYGQRLEFQSLGHHPTINRDSGAGHLPAHTIWGSHILGNLLLMIKALFSDAWTTPQLQHGKRPSTGMFSSALVFYASLSGLLLPEQGMDGKGLDSEMRPISI